VKTPREILLESHRCAEGKLDVIRERLIARRSAAEPAPLGARFIRELLLPLRWHLAGMSAAWLVFALLNLDQASPSIVAAGARGSSPRQLLVALAENRRQLIEITDAAGGELPAAPPPFIPRPRSEIRPPSALV
jgi:hypothetical protein